MEVSTDSSPDPIKTITVTKDDESKGIIVLQYGQIHYIRG